MAMASPGIYTSYVTQSSTTPQNIYMSQKQTNKYMGTVCNRTNRNRRENSCWTICYIIKTSAKMFTFRHSYSMYVKCLTESGLKIIFFK